MVNHSFLRVDRKRKEHHHSNGKVNNTKTTKIHLHLKKQCKRKVHYHSASIRKWESALVRYHQTTKKEKNKSVTRSHKWHTEKTRDRERLSTYPIHRFAICCIRYAASSCMAMGPTIGQNRGTCLHIILPDASLPIISLSSYYPFPLS